VIPRALPIFKKKNEVGSTEPTTVFMGWDEYGNARQSNRPRRAVKVQNKKDFESDDCWSESDPDFV
jgi:hypothetical protein